MPAFPSVMNHEERRRAALKLAIVGCLLLPSVIALSVNKRRA
jgi:hypothetical protein